MTAGVIYALLEILDYNPEYLPLEKFNLTTVSTLLANQEQLILWFKKISSNSKVFITAASVVNSAEVTRQGAFANIGPAMKIFEDLGIQNIICRNNINLFDITNEPTAIFLIVPDEKINRHIIASLFISQLYKANVEVAINNNGQLPREIQFYLDEFGNMPMIPHFPNFITVARSRGMHFLLILQDFKQLYEKYGEANGKTIRSNCNLNIYIQTNDFLTANAYSKMIGDQTVISKSQANNSRKQFSGNASQIGIPLIKAADLMRLKDPYGVVMYAKENPVKVYMEYAYKCKNFNLGKINIDKQIRVINFWKNHYFDLLNYDYKTKIKEEFEQQLQDLESDNSTKIKAKTLKQLREEELQIRNKIFNLNQQDFETMTIKDKISLKQYQKKLIKVLNKIKLFL